MENLPLPRQLGANVRQLRKDRGLSLAEVSARMTASGVPLSLNGLSKVELGNRGLDLHELMALAKALEVPPLLVIFPIGSEPTVEVLPGVHAPTWPVARWFTGEGRFPTQTGDGGWEAADSDRWGDEATAQFRNQQGLISDWRRFRGHASTVRQMLESGDPQKVERFRDDVERNDVAAIRAEEQLRTTRQIIRQLGLDPGALPPELAHIDEGVNGER